MSWSPSPRLSPRLKYIVQEEKKKAEKGKKSGKKKKKKKGKEPLQVRVSIRMQAGDTVRVLIDQGCS